MEQPLSNSFSSLLRSAWEVYTSQFQFFLILVACLALPIYLITDLVIPDPATQSDGTELTAATQLAALDPAAVAEDPAVLVAAMKQAVLEGVSSAGVPEEYFMLALALNVVGMVFSLLITIATIRGTRAALAGRIPDLGTELGLGSRDLGPLIVTNVLSGVVLFGLFLLLVVPGVIMGIYWAVVAPGLVLSNQRYLKALRYSYQVVRGHWWETFGVVVGSSFLVFIVALALAIALEPLAAWPGLGALVQAITHLVTLYATVVLTAYFLRLEYRKKHPEQTAAETTA